METKLYLVTPKAIKTHNPTGSQTTTTTSSPSPPTQTTGTSLPTVLATKRKSDSSKANAHLHPRPSPTRAFPHDTMCQECPPGILPECCPHQIGSVTIERVLVSLQRLQPWQQGEAYQLYFNGKQIFQFSVLTLPNNSLLRPSEHDATYRNAVLALIAYDHVIVKYENNTCESLTCAALARLLSPTFQPTETQELEDIWHDSIYQHTHHTGQNVSARNKDALDALEYAKQNKFFHFVPKEFMSPSALVSDTMLTLVNDLNLPSANAAIAKKSEMFISRFYQYINAEFPAADDAK